ncbi:Phospholipid metabolism protein [Mucor velutinosus]|uniref:Phospholipid metabolism protein n=1 Tax=Mucor velutinosus TaxID=708070 RepID=A0AAN7DJR2_9FUNG|nr:Phospholipid metabolism protein [Mucor velutinosus]
MPPTSLFQRAPVPTSNVCNTPDCLATSAFIKQYVNLNVDPCSDFFEYSCGAWINAPSTKKAKDTTRSSSADVTTNNILALVDIMETSYDDFIAKHLKSNADGFNVAEQADTDRANFQKAKDFYNTCMNPERSITEIYPDIAYLRNTLMGNHTTPETVPAQLGHVLAFFTRSGVSSIVDALVTRNDENHDYNMILFNVPKVPDEDIKSIEAAITKTLGQHNQTQQVVKASHDANIQLWSQNQVKTAIDTYVGVQEQLQNITEALNKLSEADVVASRNISGLTSVSKLIDWSAYISDLVNPEYLTSPTSTVFSIQQLTLALEKLIASLTWNELQDYFTVRFVMDRSTNGMFYAFAPSDSMYSANVTDQQATCANQVGIKLYNNVGRFFALKTFGGINEKNEVDQFIHELQSSWLNHIPGTPWLDAPTKTRAVKKINALKPRAAINMIHPDWTNPGFIQNYYQNYLIDTTSYYKTISNYYAWNTNRQWRSLGDKVLNEQWSDEGYAAYVNAFYSRQLNQFELPEGILQKIFYDAKFPKYLNYGGMGSVIGHELTHALDNNGRLFNSSGYKEDWWTPFSNEAFHNRSQCFIDQYNKDFIVNRSTGDKIQIDGENTLGENIADSGGLTIALTAYREYVAKLNQPEPLLPGLENLTQEKLFFIGYSIPRCEYYDDKLTGYNPKDAHPPWAIRVKNSLINSAEFARVFNCPAGSPMNPHKSDEDRCVIW